MPATKEITIYKWEELSQTAKDRARNWYIEGLDYEWWDCTYEMCIEDGKEKGFYIDKINFSGFYSQGGGARWLGLVDVGAWLKAHAPDTIGVSALIALINEGWVEKHVRVTSYGGGGYCHENTMEVSELEYDNRLYDTSELDEVELEIETIEGQGIFDGMSLANMRDIINTDDTNPYHLSNIHALNKDIEDSAKEYAQEIYGRLKEEYEYLCSEEMMLDHFDCNDFMFDEDGRVV